MKLLPMRQLITKLLKVLMTQLLFLSMVNKPFPFKNINAAILDMIGMGASPKVTGQLGIGAVPT